MESHLQHFGILRRHSLALCRWHFVADRPLQCGSILSITLWYIILIAVDSGYKLSHDWFSDSDIPHLFLESMNAGLVKLLHEQRLQKLIQWYDCCRRN